MVFDFRRLSRGEWLAGVAGVALVVVEIVFTWYVIRVEGILDEVTLQPETHIGAPHNAFEAFAVIDWVLLLTALVAIALPLAVANGREPDARQRLAIAVAVVGLASVALIAYRIIDPIDPLVPGAGDGVHLSELKGELGDAYSVLTRGGIWLGLACSLLLAAGGFDSALSRRREQGQTQTR